MAPCAHVAALHQNAKQLVHVLARVLARTDTVGGTVHGALSVMKNGDKCTTNVHNAGAGLAWCCNVSGGGQGAAADGLYRLSAWYWQWRLLCMVILP